MGGDYIQNKDKIINTINRYVKALILGANPELERKAYLKKLYLLVAHYLPSVNNDVLEIIANEISGNNVDAEQIHKALQSMKNNTITRQNFNKALQEI